MSRNADFSFASFDGMDVIAGHGAGLQVVGLESDFGGRASGGMDVATNAGPSGTPVVGGMESGAAL